METELVAFVYITMWHEKLYEIRRRNLDIWTTQGVECDKGTEWGAGM